MISVEWNDTPNAKTASIILDNAPQTFCATAKAILCTDELDTDNERCDVGSMIIRPPVPVFFKHRIGQPIGIVDSIICHSRYLLIGNVKLWASEECRRLAKAMQRGVYGASIGLKGANRIKQADGSTKYSDGHIFEVSIVKTAKNADCRIFDVNLLST